MSLYDQVAHETAKLVTTRFSTSFSLASRLYRRRIRQDIYSLYAMVRLADEIVDTYDGEGREQMLDTFEAEVDRAVQLGYSANPALHAFARMADRVGIDRPLIAPFFASMRMDLTPERYDAQKDYETYIYGSAEVVGLMCLRVFVEGNEDLATALTEGARRLGAAFQKVNFLRDMTDDYERLGRYYFPMGSYDNFDEETKMTIIADIEADFAAARPAMQQLPRDCQAAVGLAYRYYETLLAKLRATPAATLKTTRVRVGNGRKLWLYLQARLGVLG